MLLNAYDYLLFPLYFLLLFAIVTQWSKKLDTQILRKYFVNMFLIHCVGAFLHTMVVVYYYGSGDFLGYMQGGEFIKESVLHSGHFLKTFFLSGSEISELPGSEALSPYVFNSLSTSSSLAAMKFSAVFSILSFSHLLINALFCGFISFIGLWKLFRVFDEISLHKFQKPLALLMIYTPTIWFWGSGMGKDSLSIGLLGILVSSLYQIFRRRKVLSNLFLLSITIMLLLNLKGALLGLVCAGACGYIGVYVLNRTKNIFGRMVLFVLFIAGFTVFFINSLKTISDSLEEVQSMVESNIAAYSIESEGSEGSFEPPQFTFTPAGIAAAVPITVFSTLFRPFVWEARKPIMALSALESLLMLCSFFYVVLKGGLLQFIKTVFTQPAVMFSLIFSILLAMIIGFTTFNLGTLVRYRLPLLPFYLFMILAINERSKEKRIIKKQR